VASWVRGFFLDEDPRFAEALALALVVSAVLFIRAPGAIYTSDERAVLAASPYVNREGGIGWGQAIHRDLLGLGPESSFGAYGPVALALWRLTWGLSTATYVNRFLPILLHAVNGALLVIVTFGITRRRGLAWVAGGLFVTSAIGTATVAGAAGLAEVLVATGALLALSALRLPAWAMPSGVLVGLSLALFSRESGVVCVPLVVFAALASAEALHPHRPARAMRGLLALGASAAALVLYVRLRASWFPWPGDPLASELAVGSPFGRWSRVAWFWFHRTALHPAAFDPALALTDRAHRVAGGLRVYWRGLTQVAFPKLLVDSPSYLTGVLPQRVSGWEILAGGAVALFAPVAAIAVWATAAARAEERAGALDPESELDVPGVKPLGRRAGIALVVLTVVLFLVDELVLRPRGILPRYNASPLWIRGLVAFAPMLLAVGLIVDGRPLRGQATPPAGSVLAALVIGLFGIVVAYFPHTNVSVVLGTAHSERFWYLPAVATALCLGVGFSWIAALARGRWTAGFVAVLFVGFVGFQCAQAYRYARRYPDISILGRSAASAALSRDVRMANR